MTIGDLPRPRFIRRLHYEGWGWSGDKILEKIRYFPLVGRSKFAEANFGWG